MNKAMLETRKRMFEEKFKDKQYMMTSYERQNLIQKKLKENDTRPRVA